MTHPNASFNDYLKTWLTQHGPHHLLTRLMHAFTRIRHPGFKNWQIRTFVKKYQVDLTEAIESRPEGYADFNSFFTRALQPAARPIVQDEQAIICPVDGAVSHAGVISAERIFQAKKHDYSLVSLLGGDSTRAAPFQGGAFATLYLSPRDYHRIHMPRTGRLRTMVYVPGRLFSVNPRTTRCVPRLFARNERLVTIFDTDLGPMAVVLVGAMFVAGMETVWAGNITATAPADLEIWQYDGSLELARGAEMGRFNMGSTVILIFPPQRIQWDDALSPGAPVRMGQRLANIL